jgi:hypothetical protein
MVAVDDVDEDDCRDIVALGIPFDWVGIGDPWNFEPRNPSRYCGG